MMAWSTVRKHCEIGCRQQRDQIDHIERAEKKESRRTLNVLASPTREVKLPVTENEKFHSEQQSKEEQEIIGQFEKQNGGREKIVCPKQMESKCPKKSNGGCKVMGAVPASAHFFIHIKFCRKSIPTNMWIHIMFSENSNVYLL